MRSPAAALLALAALTFAGKTSAAQTTQPAPAEATCAVATAEPVTDAARALAAGNAARAEALYTAELATAATATNFAGLVTAQLAENKIEEAFATALRAVAAMPRSADAQALVGEASLRAGKIPEASAAYTKALALDRCSAAVHLGYARLNDLTSKHATAAREYALAHSLAPKDPEVTAAFLLNLPANLLVEKRVEAFRSFLASAPVLPPETVERLTVAAAIVEQHKTCTPVEPVGSAKLSLYGVMSRGTHARSWGLKTRINDADMPILELDSSVSGIVLNPGDARKAGVHPLLSTAPTPDALYYGVADRIRIGSLEYRDCPVRVAPAAQLAGANSLIGMDFFRDHLIHIDYPNYALTLSPYPVDPSAPTEPGAPTNHFIAPAEKTWSPVYIAGSDILIPTLLNKKGPFLFLFDTGTYPSIFSPAITKDVLLSTTAFNADIHGSSGVIIKTRALYNGSDDDHAVVTGPNGAYLKVNQPVKVPDLTFAGSNLLTNTAYSFDISPKSHATGLEISGLLGFDVLREFFLDIDYRNGLVHFVYDRDHTYEARQGSTSRPN